jgi:hypothetical protein
VSTENVDMHISISKLRDDQLRRWVQRVAPHLAMLAHILVNKHANLILDEVVDLLDAVGAEGTIMEDLKRKMKAGQNGDT